MRVHLSGECRKYGSPLKTKALRTSIHRTSAAALSLLVSVLLALGCHDSAEPDREKEETLSPSPRLALWLANKNDLIAHESATYDLVLSGWFDPNEAEAIRSRRPSSKLLAGLALNWIYNSEEWLSLLVTIANNGDPAGPLQVMDDMYLMFDDDGDGILDRRCSPPGWEGEIYAMDPRHPGWQDLILSFYEVVGDQSHHDGVSIDMLDAYPFCEGAWSEGVPAPLDSEAWVCGQVELLEEVRAGIPGEKWVFANAGRDFPEGSPFPEHLNGYLLENALGRIFGLADVAGLMASAARALETTGAPHLVVYAVDTDDTGEIIWPRLRTGLAASLLTDHTYFAFDSGPRDHGDVTEWWFPQYYNVALGDPVGPYGLDGGVYSRVFDNGLVIVAADSSISVSLGATHIDVATGEWGTDFTVPGGDARIFVRRADFPVRQKAGWKTRPPINARG